MTEKHSLLPLNPQQLTPVQTAIKRMSEKHPDFEIEPVNTIQPPEIEFTQTPQALVLSSPNSLLNMDCYLCCHLFAVVVFALLLVVVVAA